MTSTPLALKFFVSVLMITIGVVALVQIFTARREAHAREHYPPSGQFVDVDGVKIHMSVEGQGADIVLIHGASGSLRDFSFSLVNQLSDSYRVISIDRPGLGWSDRADGHGGILQARAESPKTQAQLLQEAAAKAGADKPIIVGHSFGGAVALAWALEHPDEIAGLVLLGAVSNPWPGTLGAYYRANSTLVGSGIFIPLISAFTPQRVINDTTSSIFAPQVPPDGYLQHFGPEMTLRRAAMRANVQQVNTLRPHIVEMSEQYRHINLPVEIIHGTEDTTVPIDIHSIPLSRQIPGAVLTPLAGVGHMPHHAAPNAVLAAIDRVAKRAGLRESD